ncbi:MAG: hypothetical protein ACO1PZ_12280, partial [Gammaproteobacteria bacterium]
RRSLASITATALLAAGLAAPAAAQRGDPARNDQRSAREEMRAGRILPSGEIERRVVPQMKDSNYLGLEYIAEVSAYRLKFIRQGQMTWVDVDARTGRIMRVAK